MIYSSLPVMQPRPQFGAARPAPKPQFGQRVPSEEMKQLQEQILKSRKVNITVVREWARLFNTHQAANPRTYQSASECWPAIVLLKQEAVLADPQLKEQLTGFVKNYFAFETNFRFKNKWDVLRGLPSDVLVKVLPSFDGNDMKREISRWLETSKLNLKDPELTLVTVLLTQILGDGSFDEAEGAIGVLANIPGLSKPQKKALLMLIHDCVRPEYTTRTPHRPIETPYTSLSAQQEARRHMSLLGKLQSLV